MVVYVGSVCFRFPLLVVFLLRVSACCGLVGVLGFSALAKPASPAISLGHALLFFAEISNKDRRFRLHKTRTARSMACCVGRVQLWWACVFRCVIQWEFVVCGGVVIRPKKEIRKLHILPL